MLEEKLNHPAVCRIVAAQCAKIQLSRHIIGDSSFFGIPYLYHLLAHCGGGFGAVGPKVAKGHQPSAGAGKVAPVRARPFLVSHIGK